MPYSRRSGARSRPQLMDRSRPSKNLRSAISTWLLRTNLAHCALKRSHTSRRLLQAHLPLRRNPRCCRRVTHLTRGTLGCRSHPRSSMVERMLLRMRQDKTRHGGLSTPFPVYPLGWPANSGSSGARRRAAKTQLTMSTGGGIPSLSLRSSRTGWHAALSSSGLRRETVRRQVSANWISLGPAEKQKALPSKTRFCRRGLLGND
mmetsp:Transcript_87320/g.173320  ORF Transcript_87320/g.173320 Transcript_87320/m.173320 type:complete len:204 (+) Transcript_87320:563-1174(+)